MNVVVKCIKWKRRHNLTAQDAAWTQPKSLGQRINVSASSLSLTSSKSTEVRDECTSSSYISRPTVVKPQDPESRKRIKPNDHSPQNLPERIRPNDPSLQDLPGRLKIRDPYPHDAQEIIKTQDTESQRTISLDNEDHIYYNAKTSRSLTKRLSSPYYYIKSKRLSRNVPQLEEDYINFMPKRGRVNMNDKQQQQHQQPQQQQHRLK
nr:uncharacterized protein LOC129280872 [Lytechinus pictus]